jgi:hypothetical protein
MTRSEVEALKVGNKVFWSDPDQGLCSRLLTIHGIQVGPMDDHVELLDQNGGYVCCPFSELEPWEE